MVGISARRPGFADSFEVCGKVISTSVVDKHSITRNEVRVRVFHFKIEHRCRSGFDSHRCDLFDSAIKSQSMLLRGHKLLAATQPKPSTPEGMPRCRVKLIRSKIHHDELINCPAEKPLNRLQNKIVLFLVPRPITQVSPPSTSSIGL